MSGKHNVVADAVSRIGSATAVPSSSAAVEVLGIDFTLLAADQPASEEIAAYRTVITGLTLEDVHHHGTTVLCDVSIGRPRPVVPREWTRRLFDSVHGLAHTGVRPTQRAIAARFVWHQMKKKTFNSGARNATPAKPPRSCNTHAHR